MGDLGQEGGPSASGQPLGAPCTGKGSSHCLLLWTFCLVLPPPAPSTTPSLLMFHCPDLHTPRNMEVWGGLRRTLPQSCIDGGVHSSGGGNIVLSSDLQDTASPSPKLHFQESAFTET